jgi:hypothetical protein
LEALRLRRLAPALASDSTRPVPVEPEGKKPPSGLDLAWAQAPTRYRRVLQTVGQSPLSWLRLTELSCSAIQAPSLPSCFHQLFTNTNEPCAVGRREGYWS